jgi:hypothetical protein
VVSLMPVVLNVALTAFDQGSNMFQRNTTESKMLGDGSQATTRVLQELFGVPVAAFTPGFGQPPFGSSVLEFETTRWENGAFSPLTTTRIGFELGRGEVDGNGLDDDGDGLVDEGALVLIRDFGGADEQRVVLLEGIASFLEGEVFNAADDNGNGLQDERGVSFERVGNSLVLRMTVCGVGPHGEVMQRSVRTALPLTD